MKKPFSTALFILFAAAIVAVQGCAEPRVGLHTYPANLVYLDQDRIESGMLRLSSNIWAINDLLDQSDIISAFDRERIIDLLRNLENEANALGAGAQVTNHLLIDENIDQFKSDAKAARLAIESEPPNYYLAGRLSGSCLACHVRR